MSITDPLADMLTKIRNACTAKHETVEVRGSALAERVLQVLQREGFIASHKWVEVGSRRLVRVYLKYGADQRPAIQHLRRVSKPGLRRYVGCTKIPRVRGGMGRIILSTPQGVMSDRHARRERVGGELLCEVW